MTLKSLKKGSINNLFKGFTLMELLIGSLIASVVCLAIIYSSIYYTQRLHSIKIRERAHEELKSYTDYWKGRIAGKNISSSGINSDSKQVCLNQKGAECNQQATLNALVADVTTAPIPGINDNDDSKVQRKALTTSITWNSRTNSQQKLEFYVEQLVIKPVGAAE